MNLKKIDHAEQQALEFLKRLRALKDHAHKAAEEAKARNKKAQEGKAPGERSGYQYGESPDNWVSGTRLSSSLKRASLELTTALSDLRKPS